MKKVALFLSLLLSLIIRAPLVSAEITGFPWSSGFSAASSESDGEKLSFSFQQGVEWSLADTDWTLSPFVGFSYDRSNIPIHSWNNSSKPKYGIEISNQFKFGPINWGELRIGIQKQKYYYRDKITAYREIDRKETYVRMYINGNWSQ